MDQLKKNLNGELVDLTPTELEEILALRAKAAAEAAENANKPVPRHITEFAFRNRFTGAEKVAIELATLDDPALGAALRQRAATLRVYLADLRAAAFVDLDMPTTRAGVQDLEAMGILGAGRAVQILDAEILPEELPL